MSSRHPRSNQRTKVAVCITGLGVGGAETVLSGLLQHMPNDVEVRVFALIDGGPVAERIEAMGIPVIGLHMRAGVPSVSAFVRLLTGLRDFRPDIVHTWLYHADLMGGVAARLAGVPKVIWHLHNCDVSPSRTRRMTRMVVRMLALLSHVIPDVILSCSEQASQVHVAMGYRARIIEILPNGVDAMKFRPSEESRMSVRRELGVDAGLPLIGMVARVDPQKNHRGFFDAVTAFFDSGGDAHFVLAGRDVTEDHWQLGCWRQETGRAERISLLGPRSDIPRLMASFDIATSASLGEAFPLVVIEAMSCGVPCVATDVGDCRLMIADTGIVVPPDDETVLAGAWSRLIEMPIDERRSLGARARERVLGHYTIERFSERVWSIYRALGRQ